ncbi:MAG: type II toxin-antitoxin system YafQ family toxin [Chloroflexota bacterium]
MKLVTSPRFERRARKLKPPKDRFLRAALRRFAVGPLDPLLRTHKLKGDLDGYWAFSVDDDLRVLFRWDDETFTLIGLGSHDEIY